MIVENLRKFGRLSTNDKRVVVAAIYGTIVTRILLRMFGFRQFLPSSPKAYPEAVERPSDIQIMNRARRIADLQSSGERRLLFRPSCLEHSLVLQKLLFREGIPARLCLGGRKDGDEFKAHAWIEVNGMKFDAFTDRDEYVPFGALGRDAGRASD